MKITELLTEKTIKLELSSTDKESVLDELAAKLQKAGKLNDREQFRAAIAKREEESTTGIGEGVAIPHAKTAAVKEPAIAFGRSAAGVDYQSLDGEPAYLFFMIAASEGANNEHLETLSKLSTLLLKEEFRQALLEAKSEGEVVGLIQAAEGGEPIDGTEEIEEAREDMEADTFNERGLILAVTACPTGIAHTYMAADSIKAKAAEMGYDVKVQTNGSTGIKNRLEPDEIDRALGIIVAADTKVDMAPFAGKPVIEVPVADGIRRPEELINQVAAGDAPIYGGDNSSYQDEIQKGKADKKSRQPAFYKHLMNGVSYMLPFVVGGGILVALSFFFGIHSADKDSSQYNAFAALINQIGGLSLGMLVPILAGYIAYSIGERPALVPGLVGGLMANGSGAGFLGGLIAGFLAGYVILLLKAVFKKLPQSLEGLKPVLIYPVLGLFITGIILSVLNPFISAITDGLTDWINGLGTNQLVIMGVILGGMMAVDLGGPVNKTAYAFGLAMIDQHFYAPQAAIMAGGMVPPLGMAIATTIFARKFNQAQRDAGKTAYALGAAFITEGTIPFAAADPLRVIVSGIIGSAVAGGLSMLFHITLQAPHGGIFVIPFVGGSAWLYLVAIIIGALVTGLIYGFWKKPIDEA